MEQWRKYKGCKIYTLSKKVPEFQFGNPFHRFKLFLLHVMYLLPFWILVMMFFLCPHCCIFFEAGPVCCSCTVYLVMQFFLSEAFPAVLDSVKAALSNGCPIFLV